MFKRSACLFLLAVCSFVNRAADAQTLSLQPENGYLKSYFTDTKDIALQPVHWKKREWIVVGSSAAVFTALYFTDLRVQEYAQSVRSPQSDWVSKNVADPLGNGFYTLPALGLFYASGWLFEQPKNRHVALQATKALVLSAGAATLIKQVAHRQRPNEGPTADPTMWMGPYAITSKNTSFYSRHTTSAFAIATVFAQNYEAGWVAPVSYGLATIAGLSRINDNAHWASDVFVGALMGYWIGKSVSKLHPNLNWSASVNQKQYNLNLVWRL